MKQVLLVLALAVTVVACRDGGGSPTDPSQVNIEFSTTDLTVGTGPQAAAGNAATVHYELWLYNAAGVASKGNRIEGSRDPTSPGPFTLVLGARQVIPGFEQAVVGMQAGGKRRAYLPSSLAYGSQGNQRIPPNAALVFEIDLVTLVQ